MFLPDSFKADFSDISRTLSQRLAGNSLLRHRPSFTVAFALSWTAAPMIVDG
jgi:hypothetical protein